MVLNFQASFCLCLVFRDTQAAIKSEKPDATFGEVSKIVASMWEGLDEDVKKVCEKNS